MRLLQEFNPYVYKELAGFVTIGYNNNCGIRKNTASFLGSAQAVETKPLGVRK